MVASLRILVVTAMYPHPERPDHGTFVARQVESIRRLGHHVDVLHFPGYRNRLLYLKCALDVRRATRRARYDVVHAHFGLAGLPALFRKGKVPLVVTLHGTDAVGSWWKPPLSRIVHRFADAVIVVARPMTARFPGTVIPCGVDLERFRPLGRERSRARIGLPPEKLLILFPFDPARKIKRFDLAREAVDRLVAAGLDAGLHVVRGVPHDEMPWHYSASDALILCSDSEGSPTVVKEALACDLPVVGVDVGDVRDVLAGVEGAEVVARDPDSLSGALRRVTDRAAERGFEGRAAVERFGEPGIAAEVVKVYRRAVSSGA